MYTAWVAEADQRAFKPSRVRMPAPPILNGSVATLEAKTGSEEHSPYLRIATDLRAIITCGDLIACGALPTVDNPRYRYSVSAGAVNRAVAILKVEGIVTASCGRRAVVSNFGQTQ